MRGTPLRPKSLLLLSTAFLLADDMSYAGEMHSMAGIESLNSATMSPDTSSTLYVPIVSPPTPAPSPRPMNTLLPRETSDPAHFSRLEFAGLAPLGLTARQQYLASLLNDCTPAELLFVSTTIAPLLKRDFLRELPPELSLHVLSYVDDPQTLARAGKVSKYWQKLVKDETTWKRMCAAYKFRDRWRATVEPEGEAKTEYARQKVRVSDFAPAVEAIPQVTPRVAEKRPFSYKRHFETSYQTSTLFHLCLLARPSTRRLAMHVQPYLSLVRLHHSLAVA